MSNPSEIGKHSQLRLRTLAYYAEIIARSRKLLASSETLLQSSIPSTFLGNYSGRRTVNQEQADRLTHDVGRDI